MDSRSFAGFSARPSPWGYNWTTDQISTSDFRTPPPPSCKSNSALNNNTSSDASSPEPHMQALQYAHMPAALLTSLKRDKKPFTYTPGGVNLDEVLTQRLNKRMERKKRYSEERGADSFTTFDPPPKQVMVAPTYNTPLQMYSMENAIEALEVQAELVAHDKSLSSPSRSATLPRNHRFDDRDTDPERGVSQSKAFRVLQIITDTEAEPTLKGRGSPVHQDEMRWTGLRESKDIPSRFFHTLQKITGTDDDEQNDTPPTTTRVEAPRPAMFQQPAQHPPSLRPATHQPKVVTFQESGPVLKRPAAFLPIKTGQSSLPRVRPVQPDFLLNGGARKAFNPAGGTDF